MEAPKDGRYRGSTSEFFADARKGQSQHFLRVAIRCVDPNESPHDRQACPPKVRLAKPELGVLLQRLLISLGGAAPSDSIPSDFQAGFKVEGDISRYDGLLQRVELQNGPPKLREGLGGQEVSVEHG